MLEPGDSEPGGSEPGGSELDAPRSGRPAVLGDFVDLVYGIFITPAATLRQVARRPQVPLGAALLAYLLAVLILGLVAARDFSLALRLTAGELGAAGLAPPSAGLIVPVANAALVTVLGALLFGPIGLFVKTGALGLSAAFFGGRGDGRRLLACFALTYLPALAGVPVTLLIGGRPGFGLLAFLIRAAILIWRVVLDVIAVREVHALETRRAAAAVFVPAGVALAAALVVIAAMFWLLMALLGPWLYSGLPGVG